MSTIYDYIGQLFIGHTYHFTCDCIASIDVEGTVIDYEVRNPEIVLVVQTKNMKIIRIGTNHPNLHVEQIS